MDSPNQTPPKDQLARQQFLIDVGKMYQFKADDMVPDVKNSSYSNVAYLTCTNRDVFIDFLEMPGMKKDGKMMIPATRVYMSHSAAQQLAIQLAAVLEGSYQRGEMDSYNPQPTNLRVKMKEEKRRI